MNKFMGNKHDLYEICQQTNLVDSISLLDSELNNDPTYLWGSKWIKHIPIYPTLAELAVKAGHHHFNQHFISDHKGYLCPIQSGRYFRQGNYR